MTVLIPNFGQSFPFLERDVANTISKIESFSTHKEAAFMKLSELSEERRKRLEKQIYVDGSDIVVALSYDYRIPIARCDTAERLLDWVLQLSDKTWMTTEALGLFILIACEQSNIKIENA